MRDELEIGDMMQTKENNVNKLLANDMEAGSDKS